MHGARLSESNLKTRSRKKLEVAQVEINYQEIGKRIRLARIGKNYTQDMLAEIVNLSTPHMSHIESGKTKLSLPTLVRIANALNCTVDQLLCDSLDNAKILFENEILLETKDCSEEEIRIITDMIKALKKSLRKRCSKSKSHYE